MFLKCNTYLLFWAKKIMPGIVVFLFLGLSACAQQSPGFHINPLRVSGLNQPLKANPNLNDHFKSPAHELMYWPNFPLTAQQIEQRDRYNNRPFGQQVAEGVTETFIKSLLKSRKPVAKTPRF